MIGVDPGQVYEVETAVFDNDDNLSPSEYKLILSYVGGDPITQYAQGWVKLPVISNKLKIKIQKSKLHVPQIDVS